MTLTPSHKHDADDTAPERIVELTRTVSEAAYGKIASIRSITGRTKILALNALIESARAGEAGRSFAVVASEVKQVSQEIEELATDLEQDLTGSVAALERVGAKLIEHVRGQRLSDLALNAIEIIDRNLYERTCDVRWWATDSAIVEVAANPSQELVRHASARLGVILDAYTVYLDLWICDLAGNVIANGRPDMYPAVVGIPCSSEAWFQQALATVNGDEYSVADISVNRHLGNRMVATYAAAIRENGEKYGKIIGVMGIHFDWGPQAASVVKGVRLSPDEAGRTRVMLLDSQYRIIASSDDKGILNETFHVETSGRVGGFYRLPDGRMVGFAKTPGYETYRGLGWMGCIVQTVR
jgi:hypothetical protein